MMEFTSLRQFKPPGPIAGAYIKDRSSILKALLGPVGSGKTTANVFDSIRAPSLMPPCNDGVIRYRRAIIGTTYGQLERNLYPSWKRWLPEDGGDFTPASEWKGGGGRSATHTLEWDVVRGHKLVPVRAEYVFAAIGELDVELFMRGFEPTDIWCFEMDQLPEAVIDVGVTRIGRYPPTGDDPDAVPRDVPFHACVCGDLNAPDDESWFYKLFEEGRAGQLDADGMPIEPIKINGVEIIPKVYKQPSGRSPRAENRANLRPDYYDRMIGTLARKQNGKNLIKRMVDAQYAPTQAGNPVYGDVYNDDVHALPEIAALPSVPLVIGFDQGLGQPAAIISQPTPRGQLRVLAEVVPGRMSARRFAARVRDKIAEIAPGVPLAEVHYCDPAGFTGADREDGEQAWAEIVAAELGIVVEPAETNEIQARLTAVTDDLTTMIEPEVPALVISRKQCQKLRKGFLSQYKYEVRPDEKSQAAKPIKNIYSNPHDGLQYLELGLKGRYGVIAGPRDARAPERNIGRAPSRGDARRADDGCVVIDAPVDF
jgi:hypothetical protein